MDYISELKKLGWEIGTNVTIEDGVVLKADHGRIGSNTHIGKNVRMDAEIIHIGENCIFFPNTDIKVNNEFSIGNRGKISRNTCFRANSIIIGHDFWCNEQAEVGGGGWQKNTADLSVGNLVHVGKGASINVCCPVTIGSYTGIGIECMIFTHSSGNGQSILEGYKHVEAPVHIGNHVSLFTRDIIAPGTRVEDNVTVAAMSFVRGTTEERGFYAGCPASLKKKTVPVNKDRWYELLRDVLKTEINEALYVPWSSGYNEKEPVFYISEMKEEYADCLSNCDRPIVISGCGSCNLDRTAVFDIENMIVSGEKTSKTEKVRNALRRNGILFEFGEYYVPDLLQYEKLVSSGIERL